MSDIPPRVFPLVLAAFLALVGCCGEGKAPSTPVEHEAAEPAPDPGPDAAEPEPEPAPTLVSGEYHSLKIAHDPATGEVSGYYWNATGYDEELDAPRFFCVFALRGELEGGQARLATAYPGPGEVIGGTLLVNDDGSLHITLDEEHGGCWNVQPDFPRSEGGVTFRLQTQHPWTAVRVVKARKAFFHGDADLGTRRKAYCVTDDVLPVKSSKPGWVEGQFEYKDKVTEGWVQEDDLYRLPVLPD